MIMWDKEICGSDSQSVKTPLCGGHAEVKKLIFQQRYGCLEFSCMLTNAGAPIEQV